MKEVLDELKALRLEIAEFRAHDAQRKDRANDLLLQMSNKLTLFVILAIIYVVFLAVMMYFPLINLVNVVV